MLKYIHSNKFNHSILLYLVLIPSLTSPMTTSSRTEENGATPEHSCETKEKVWSSGSGILETNVCPGVLVTNGNRDILKLFRHCHIIDGNFEMNKINMFENPKNWTAFSLPNLTEIRGYLLVNKEELSKKSDGKTQNTLRVYGPLERNLNNLQSLLDLKSVIISEKPYNHTVVWSLYSLSEILPSLAVIRGQNLFKGHGFIISKSKIKNLGLQNLRVGGGCSIGKDKLTPVKETPTTCIRLDESPDKLCSDCSGGKCQGSDGSLSCCGPQCLGGCGVDSTTNLVRCAACRNVLSNGYCVPHCHTGLLLYKDYYCVSKEKCVEDFRGLVLPADGVTVHQPKCVKECPLVYETRDANSTCHRTVPVNCCDKQPNEVGNPNVMTDIRFSHVSDGRGGNTNLSMKNRTTEFSINQMSPTSVKLILNYPETFKTEIENFTIFYRERSAQSWKSTLLNPNKIEKLPFLRPGKSYEAFSQINSSNGIVEHSQPIKFQFWKSLGPFYKNSTRNSLTVDWHPLSSYYTEVYRVDYHLVTLENFDNLTCAGHKKDFLEDADKAAEIDESAAHEECECNNSRKLENVPPQIENIKALDLHRIFLNRRRGSKAKLLSKCMERHKKNLEYNIEEDVKHVKNRESKDFRLGIFTMFTANRSVSILHLLTNRIYNISITPCLMYHVTDWSKVSQSACDIIPNSDYTVSGLFDTFKFDAVNLLISNVSMAEDLTYVSWSIAENIPIIDVTVTITELQSEKNLTVLNECLKGNAVYVALAGSIRNSNPYFINVTARLSPIHHEYSVLYIEVPEAKIAKLLNKKGINLVIILVMILITAFVLSLFIFKKMARAKKKKKYSCHKARIRNQKENIGREIYNTTNPLILSDIGPEYILSPDQLSVESVFLGNGHFGVVKMGLLTQKDGTRVPVAVKLLHEPSATIISEANIMFKLNSPHVLRALGIIPSRDNKPSLKLVLEYMNGGNLYDYLIRQGARECNILTKLSVSEVLMIASQICDGMLYLNAINIVHRDLAARNCLLDDKMNVKVSDFGLSRAIETDVCDYYKMLDMRKEVPVRSMPPEFFIYGKYSFKSDVWSYGVLLWEIFSGGASPYPGIPAHTIGERIVKGLTLNSFSCDIWPTFIKDVMIQCWRYEPSRRPHFKDILQNLLLYTPLTFNNHFRDNSFFWSTLGRKFIENCVPHGNKLGKDLMPPVPRKPLPNIPPQRKPLMGLGKSRPLSLALNCVTNTSHLRDSSSDYMFSPTSTVSTVVSPYQDTEYIEAKDFSSSQSGNIESPAEVNPKILIDSCLHTNNAKDDYEIMNKVAEENTLKDELVSNDYVTSDSVNEASGTECEKSQTYSCVRNKFSNYSREADEEKELLLPISQEKVNDNVVAVDVPVDMEYLASDESYNQFGDLKLVCKPSKVFSNGKKLLGKGVSVDQLCSISRGTEFARTDSDTFKYSSSNCVLGSDESPVSKMATSVNGNEVSLDKCGQVDYCNIDNRFYHSLDNIGNRITHDASPILKNVVKDEVKSFRNEQLDKKSSSLKISEHYKSTRSDGYLEVSGNDDFYGFGAEKLSTPEGVTYVDKDGSDSDVTIDLGDLYTNLGRRMSPSLSDIEMDTPPSSRTNSLDKSVPTLESGVDAPHQVLNKNEENRHDDYRDLLHLWNH